MLPNSFSIKAPPGDFLSYAYEKEFNRAWAFHASSWRALSLGAAAADQLVPA
jgi:hypothetical protein